MRTANIFVGVAFAVMAAGTAARAETPARPRPPTWATPIPTRGVPNLHQVAPGLYRGAQPTAEGFRALEKMGVRTVVNLRANHSDLPLTRGTRLRSVAIPMRPWKVDEADVATFLRIAIDRKRQPVFVHCQHGADRTGAMIAAYRMVVQGWTFDEAIREMKDGGFGYHSVWQNLPELLHNLDIARLRIASGLDPEPAGEPGATQPPQTTDVTR